MTSSIRTRRRPGVLIGAVAIAFGLVAAACGGDDGGSSSGGGETTAAPAETTAPAPATQPPADDDTPVPGGKMVFGLEADTASPWTPADMTCAVSCHMVARTVYDSLMVPGADNVPHPYLAESMTPNDDYTEWRITARSGVKFHDGTDFDGAAIVDNLTRAQGSFLVGSALLDVDTVTLDPADPMTAIVTTKRPWATFPWFVTGQAGYMASPTWLAAVDGDAALAAKPVGTGPFTFVDYKPNEFYKGAKNADYWNAPYPYLDEIEFIPINDALKRRDALKAGDIDALHLTNGEAITEFRDSDEFSTIEITKNGETAYTLLHVTKEGSAIADSRVRCALAYASDSATTNEVVSFGVNQLANGPFSPDQVGYLEDSGYPLVQDMAKAQELIAEYKAENPGDLKIALATTTDATNLVIANYQKGWWEEAGVDEVTIDQIDQGNYIVTALLGNFEVFQWRNHGGVDLDQQFFWWHSSAALPVGALALNFGRIKDANLDALLEENRGTLDPVRKKEIAEEVNRLFATECYNLWGSYTIWMVAGKPEFKGYAAANLILPDGTPALEGSGIAGTFYMATVWKGN
ncbi:MAG: ABC transporter substrate-binding protein [Ilumatobacteraceae bacterium]